MDSLPSVRFEFEPDREGGGVMDWVPVIMLVILPAGELAMPGKGA